jgi:hypothetical protein
MKEIAPGIYSFNPGDIITYTNSVGFSKQYIIMSVIIGGENEESYVELECAMNLTVPLHFPISLLNAAIESGRCKIYKG